MSDSPQPPRHRSGESAPRFLAGAAQPISAAVLADRYLAPGEGDCRDDFGELVDFAFADTAENL